MKYLLDTNIFLQCYKEYYCMDICSGFWDFILKNENIHSIKKVYSEIEPNKENGDLMNFIENLNEKGFFIKEESIKGTSFINVTNAIENYKESRKNPKNETLCRNIDRFLDGADYFLISLAYQEGYTIVTHETLIEQPNSNKIKIPDICKELKIKCIRIEELLRNEDVNLLLGHHNK